MKELGADKSGRISFDEFVRRRLELRTEINALRVHIYDPLPEYLPTSSDNSLGKFINICSINHIIFNQTLLFLIKPY